MILAAAVPGTAPSASAQSTPNYGETISLNIKTVDHGWHLEMAYNQPASTMQEFTPEGQTGQNWTEMITVTALKNNPRVNTGQMIVGMIQRFRGVCGSVQVIEANEGQETDSLRASAGLPATYKTYTALVRCDDPKATPNPNVLLKKHEVMLLKGMQGWLTAYLVQRAWHSDEIPADSVLSSDATREEWRQWLSGVKVAGIPAGVQPDSSATQPAN